MEGDGEPRLAVFVFVAWVQAQALTLSPAGEVIVWRWVVGSILTALGTVIVITAKMIVAAVKKGVALVLARIDAVDESVKAATVKAERIADEREARHFDRLEGWNERDQGWRSNVESRVASCETALKLRKQDSGEVALRIPQRESD